MKLSSASLSVSRRMAEASISVDQDQLSCAVCLDLLNDPVTIPCGHSYCMDCINGCWGLNNHTRVYKCPQCRHAYSIRPVIMKNTMLAEVVEQLKTRLQTAPPAHFYAGPGDVACDFCSKKKLKAVKSCLVCLASYCETHLQPHHESAALKKHKLVKATGDLLENICSVHDKLLEVYCRTDQRCICHLCAMDEHRGHDTVSAAAERTEKQRQLGTIRSKVQQRIQEREEELQDLRQAVEALEAGVQDSEILVRELIRAIKGRRSEVKGLIKDQEEAEVSHAQRLLKRLEQEIAMMRRRDTELEHLSHTEDHIHFLRSCQSLCVPTGPGGLTSITAGLLVSFDSVGQSISYLKERMEDICQEESVKISEIVTCELTLDPNTVHRNLRLSEGDRKVTHVREIQSHPDHPERFDCWEQVLCREGLSGRCYWEAEWSGDGVYIAVSYKDISRKGGSFDSGLGYNNKSWSLRCSPSSFYFWHNNESIKIPVPPSSRVGVYLDRSAGTLSFYSISDTMTLLHRVQTTFTQPLYPGFWVYKSYVKLSLKVMERDHLGGPSTDRCGQKY